MGLCWASPFPRNAFRFDPQQLQHFSTLMCSHKGFFLRHTLDKNGSLYDPSGTESCNMQIRLVTLLVRMIYIYGTMVTTSCDLQLRPGASPQSRGYVYTGPREVSSLVTDLPGTPVTPRLYMIILVEVLRLFRRYTHTPRLRQGGACKNEMKMRMKGE